MKLNPDNLSRHLDPLQPLYVVHGDEPLLVIEAADTIRAAARQQGYSEREIMIVTLGFKWDDLFMAADNLSLFGDKQLIDLCIPTAKPGREGSSAIGHYCENLPQDVLTLVTLPELDWATKKSTWFSSLAEAGHVIECNAPPLAQLPSWIAARLKLQGQTAPPDALELIAGHVEGNLLAAQHEILKLGLLYPKGDLSRQQIEDAVLDVSRFDIDALRAGLANNDIARCARVLEGLQAEDVPHPLVLWAMVSEIRKLIQSNPHKRMLARGALMRAARIDRIIKGIARGNPWDEYLQLGQYVTRALVNR